MTTDQIATIRSLARAGLTEAQIAGHVGVEMGDVATVLAGNAAGILTMTPWIPMAHCYRLLLALGYADFAVLASAHSAVIDPDNIGADDTPVGSTVTYGGIPDVIDATRGLPGSTAAVQFLYVVADDYSEEFTAGQVQYLWGPTWHVAADSPITAPEAFLADVLAFGGLG